MVYYDSEPKNELDNQIVKSNRQVQEKEHAYFEHLSHLSRLVNKRLDLINVGKKRIMNYFNDRKRKSTKKRSQGVFNKLMSSKKNDSLFTSLYYNRLIDGIDFD